MEYNFVSNIEQCVNLIRDTVPVGFIYYSHIPTALIALFFGMFVFIKDSRSLVSKTLLGISTTFAFWLVIDLITWVMNYNSVLTMFVWSLFGIFDILLFIFSLWFVYVFIYKEDIAFYKKVTLGVLLLPVIIATPTALNLTGYDAVNCNSVESGYIDYITVVQVIILLWIIVTLIRGYKKVDVSIKSQIILLGTGIVTFLVLFLGVGYLADYLVTAGIVSNYTIEPYGFFGMNIFLGLLAYLIVKYKAFNIKLLGTQALVILLIFLIGALLFYVQETGGKILIIINLVLALFFGWLLVKSVKLEVKQREELEVANKEISERKDQLQKMADSLAIANDKLKQLDQAKTDFINIASHQLKHAPTPIKGYLSLILDGSFGEVPEKLVKPLKNIDTANDRQILLVDDLLAVARMESGRVQLDFQKQHIEDICQGVYDNLAVTAKEKNLAFEYAKPQQPLPELVLDRGKIFEAIFNFVDNAVKYTTSGNVTLKAELAQLSNYKPRTDMSDQKPVIIGPVVRVTVSDTGSGISQENISHLFTKFSRRDVAKVNADGTGLGLYVVKLMIEAHGGRTWAESDGEGKGSKFIIEIPVEQPKEIFEQHN